MRWQCLWVVLLATRLSATEFVVPLAAQPPTPDGRIQPGEWTGAAFDGFAWQHRLERRRGRGFITATATDLYVACRTQLPAEGGLLAAVDKDIEKLVFDDSAEVWLDLTPGTADGATYQMITNPLGRRYFALHPRGSTQPDPGWRGDWTVACSQHDGWWDLECRVPLATLAPGRRATDGAFGLNLCRNWKQEWAFSSLGGGGYKPDRDVVVRFVATGAPQVAHEQRRDPLAADVESALVVRSDSPLRVKARQRLERDTMPEVTVEQTLDLAAGRPAEVVLRCAPAGSVKQHQLKLEVTSEDGQTVYYRRAVAWVAQPGEWAWKTARQVKPPIDVQFAYYPYLDKLRLLADVSGLPPEAKLARVDVQLRRKGRPGEVVKRLSLDHFDANGRQAIETPLPGLDGEYELVATAMGANVPAGEVVKPLVRTRYEWERNPAGRRAAVYAPFTALRWSAADQTVSAALRTHRLNGLGLWDQVTARSAHTGVERPLLAAPMRFRVTSAAGQATVTPATLGVTTTGDAQQQFTGGFSAGPLTARTACTMEVDGLQRVALTLQPTGGQTIHELTLEIPLRADQATLMHAMAEGIRNSIWSQAIPAGQGVVWDAGKLAVSEFPRNFGTYLFCGSPVRGLCWFAENDAGWSWDAAKPNLELVREGETVLMRVHLVNKPVVLTAPRTITFGLQAAPLKPRLAPWRWRFWRDRYSILGTDINWLALGDCGSVYPAGKDLYLWDMIRRGNREKLTEADLQAVIAHGRKYWEPYGPQAVENFVRHARYNLTGRYGTKMVFYYNRASYQAADEFQTFEDEWSKNDYRSIGPGRGIGEIPIVPSESYTDHALWWYAKSFDLGGNQAVYWDNWFIQPSQNTVMTDAYRRADGAIMPAAGLWGLRELSRRTFNLMHERRMLPLTMPHMTSTNILPLHGFATVQYDLEWRYSEGDMQDRFTREYLLLCTTGELAGTWPVLLGDQGNKSEDAWIQRTYAAVSIVHELDPTARAWSKTWQSVWKPLMDPILALLDDPGLQVWRYWDERPQPATTGHPDLPTIVYAVPGKTAVVAVVSYARQDEEVTLKVDAKALGFGGAVTVKDAETSEALPVTDGAVRFRLKKHDIRELRLQPQA